MHILGKQWLDSYLDYSLGEGELRVQVACWANVAPVRDMFLEHPKSLTLVWEYLKEIGIRSVIHKIRSRMKESLRNEVYYSIGLGRIAQSRTTEPWPDGVPVAFVAPCHPKCVERVVLPAPLVRRVSKDLLGKHGIADGILWYPVGPEDALEETLFAWQPESGIALDAQAAARALDAAEAYWNDGPRGLEQRLPLASPTPVVETVRRKSPVTAAPLRGVLFGLGNYAKTQILPSLGRHLQIEAVHEVNPAQIGRVSSAPWDVSTSPRCPEDVKYDVHFIAGYHHTHADQAIAALERGAVAVVEKPLVTTEDQLQRLLGALQRTQGKLFACFHMRYNPLFALAREDLQAEPGDPIHCACEVFEVSLPRRHWYHWPNSGSHLISNGCHWIDHFLFMNAYAAPKQHRLVKSSNGDTALIAELDNGAVLHLHLTHVGSPRIGVQDHVVMRAGDRAVTVTNGATYLAEARLRAIRRKRINRVHAYRRMYRTIAEAIVHDEPGDSDRSIRVTSQFVLELEREWQGR